jgi:kynurenine 3-monooxygenase
MLVRDLNENKDIGVDFDFCVGADGSYSVVRRQLMRVVRCVPFPYLWVTLVDYTTPHDVLRMDYQQEYIPHEYIELKMPAGFDKDSKPCSLLDPNHLHIWPRHSFMLIALPNKVSKYAYHFHSFMNLI